MKYTPKYLLPAVIALSCALATPVYAADADNDGVDDAIDNCLGKSNTDQRDTDGDGFGNRCDGDLNNDGKTNSLDLGLFKKKLGTTNPDADFNGDGIVNAADTSLLQQLSQKVPGPTAIKTDPELADNPPEVDAMDTAELDNPLPDGRNAAFFVKFKTTPDKKAIVILENDKPVALNDIGVSPDQVAKDGVFSGFASVDFTALTNQEAELEDRIATIPNPTVTVFSGRSVIETKPFAPVEMPSVFDKTFLLPANMTLRPTPDLDSPILPVTFNDKEKVLAITDPLVIADPVLTGHFCNGTTTGNIDGAWSFKTLMSNMAGSNISPNQFINDWLKNWKDSDVVNTFGIDARPGVTAFFPGWDGSTASTLNINKLPFRLLAIMNRMDLGKSSTYGIGQPGETRFVFGLLNPNTCQPKQMTVILEYSDPPLSCSAQQARANQWIALDSLSLTSDLATYQAQLLAITNTVTLPNIANSSWPNHGYNGSAINQVRTNDIAFASTWELREFRLLANNTSLKHDTLKQTPDKSFKNTANLARYMEENANDILLGKYTVPLNLPASAPFNPPSGPFLGSSIKYNGGSVWDAPTNQVDLPSAFPPGYIPSYDNSSSASLPDRIQSEVRHKFSLNTCDDCHSGETQTSFTHVSNPITLPAGLSDFLTGSNVIGDPLIGGIDRQFNDLQRRAQILESIANQSCSIRMIDSFRIEQAGFRFVH